MSADRRARILTVCTHNRTRSVMMAALLERMLAERVGADAVVVRSAGVSAAGLPAIDDAVAAMRRRGLDVSAHRSMVATAQMVDGADLIVTAERDHVVKIATMSPSAFPRAMTLPELLGRSTDIDTTSDTTSDTDSDTAADGGLRRWAEALTSDRRAGDYLRGRVEEVDDPTGSSTRAFEAAVVAIERQCLELAVLVADRLST